tara:strand:- start:1173 stop:1688 length:516 start_codon:yes stop_codon:yes gene_type:complete
MERIHIIIGFIIFIVFAGAAAADSSLTTEERIVALTLLGEARGESEIGVYGVACVIQKRAAQRKLTPAQVCLQPWQFSIWNAGKGKVKKESELDYLWDSKCIIVRYAKLVAKSICANQQLNHAWVGDANHYYSTDISPPYWTFKKVIKNGREVKVPIKPVAKIGKHVFYKL